MKTRYWLVIAGSVLIIGLVLDELFLGAKSITSWLMQWLDDWGILVLATAAFAGPYWVMWARRKYYSPKLDIEFKDEDPYCRHEKTEEDLKPYYCHFVVVNSGLSQADDCEAVLEKIWDSSGEKENLEWQERKNWIPVNLKWSAEEKNPMRACFKTIYPGGRRYFCDIARVDLLKKGARFAFELPWTFISQDTYLPLGKYKIQISVYSKNAAKVAKDFIIDWCGGWKDTQEKMQKCLKIKML